MTFEAKRRLKRDFPGRDGYSRSGREACTNVGAERGRCIFILKKTAVLR